MVSSTVTNNTNKNATQRHLGLVAGEGKLPAYLAQAAKAKGYKITAFALSDDAQARVLPHADRVFLIAPGQLGRNIKLFLDEKVQDVVFVGKVPKIALLRSIHKLDWTAVKELSKLPNFNDDTIQAGIADVIETRGLKVVTQREFLQHLFPEVGVLTRRQPTANEYADIDYGFTMAREIARLDIGQTVVVRDRMILAIEAIEGTDEAIRRGVKLAHGPVVVVKVSKPNQDPRFDVPTVGVNTLESLTSDKPGGVLAIEANETMVVDKDAMVAYADAHDMTIVAVKR